MLNDPSITPILTMGSNIGAADREDITTTNPAGRKSTSSAKNSTTKIWQKSKKIYVEDLKEYFEERDKKFMNTLKKCSKRTQRVWRKLWINYNTNLFMHSLLRHRYCFDIGK